MLCRRQRSAFSALSCARQWRASSVLALVFLFAARAVLVANHLWIFWLALEATFVALRVPRSFWSNRGTFGLASPRHAAVLVMTGPLTRNTKAVRLAWDAMPSLASSTTCSRVCTFRDVHRIR